ncbi:MAG: hypothetical protein GX542_02180 [Rhodococcus sp.]|nr:hypothetical protein [Rhodococcus sp. (in: high G+C Gram-positive bacteria)]
MTETLYLDDGTAAECVALCDDLIAKFDEAIRETRAFENISGFGGFDSAKQLQRGFEEKLINSPDSVKNRLIQFQDAVKLLRATFEANGRGFEDTESEIYQAIRAIGSAEQL